MGNVFRRLAVGEISELCAAEKSQQRLSANRIETKLTSEDGLELRLLGEN
jgi:hypothetical protein